MPLKATTKGKDTNFEKPRQLSMASSATPPDSLPRATFVCKKAIDRFISRKLSTGGTLEAEGVGQTGLWGREKGVLRNGLFVLDRRRGK